MELIDEHKKDNQFMQNEAKRLEEKHDEIIKNYVNRNFLNIIFFIGSFKVKS